MGSVTMNLYEFSDKTLAKMLGQATKQERLNVGIKRTDLMRMGDLNNYQLRKVETGDAFLPLLPVLRALGMLDRLEALLEVEEVVEPKQIFSQAPARQRVRD